MAYRDSQRTQIDELTVRPQRAPTSAIFSLIGLGMLLGVVVGVAAGLRAGEFTQPVVLIVLFLAGVMLSLMGANGWFYRVEMRRLSDGALLMRWVRWPLAPRVRELRFNDIAEVVIETDDGTSKIVLVTPAERIALTGTATSDNLQGKAEQIRAFFRSPS